MGSFVINTRQNSFYYFQFKAENGETLLISEAYTSKGGCMNGIKAVISYAKNQAEFIVTRSSSSTYYSFFLKAPNGQILAHGERNKDLDEIKHVISYIKLNASSAIIEDKTVLSVA
jgi:uncharacterized protein